MAVPPGGLLDDAFERLVRQVCLPRQCFHLLNIGPMMLAMMDLQRGSRDMRLQSVVRVWKLRQGDLHRRLLERVGVTRDSAPCQSTIVRNSCRVSGLSRKQPSMRLVT